jgi:hypothetical protein
MEPDRTGGKGKWIALVVVGVIIIALGGYYLFSGKPAKESLPVTEPPKSETAAPAPKPAPVPAKEPLPAARPSLADSDDWVRKKGQELSSEPSWLQWLANKNLIRRLTAAVVNISEGKSPRKHLSFLGPQKPFTALKKEGSLFLDPQAYDRYNLAAEIFSRLDAARTVGFFKELAPLFQEAYRELGYPQGEFQAVLIHAIKELLLAPVVEGDVRLKEAVLSYWMVDDSLEDLSEAQKHLLRMGPQNTRKIQKKLREMALLLGASENQLPKSKVVTAKNTE